MTWRAKWVGGKQALAARLQSGEAGGGYSEAVLILSAVISALAAEAWPGEDKIDRKRFNEILAKHTPANLNATCISVPLLIGSLRKSGNIADANKAAEALVCYDDTRVLTGSDVDRSEDEIRALLPQLDLLRIRKCSYANLLYEEVRSPYVHGYRPGKRADSHPMTSRDADVSYTNWMDNPDRSIHFHGDWISLLALPIAQALDASEKNLPFSRPIKWWIEG